MTATKPLIARSLTLRLLPLAMALLALVTTTGCLQNTRRTVVFDPRAPQTSLAIDFKVGKVEVVTTDGTVSEAANAMREGREVTLGMRLADHLRSRFSPGWLDLDRGLTIRLTHREERIDPPFFPYTFPYKVPFHYPLFGLVYPYTITAQHQLNGDVTVFDRDGNVIHQSSHQLKVTGKIQHGLWLGAILSWIIPTGGETQPNSAYLRGEALVRLAMAEINRPEVASRLAQAYAAQLQ